MVPSFQENHRSQVISLFFVPDLEIDEAIDVAHALVIDTGESLLVAILQTAQGLAVLKFFNQLARHLLIK